MFFATQASTGDFRSRIPLPLVPPPPAAWQQDQGRGLLDILSFDRRGSEARVPLVSVAPGEPSVLPDPISSTVNLQLAETEPASVGAMRDLEAAIEDIVPLVNDVNVMQRLRDAIRIWQNAWWRDVTVARSQRLCMVSDMLVAERPLEFARNLQQFQQARAGEISSIVNVIRSWPLMPEHQPRSEGTYGAPFSWLRRAS